MPNESQTTMEKYKGQKLPRGFRIMQDGPRRFILWWRGNDHGWVFKTRQKAFDYAAYLAGRA